MLFFLYLFIIRQRECLTDEYCVLCVKNVIVWFYTTMYNKSSKWDEWTMYSELK